MHIQLEIAYPTKRNDATICICTHTLNACVWDEVDVDDSVWSLNNPETRARE